MVRIIVVLCGLFVPVFSVWATVWNIPGDFSTVQAAIDARDPEDPYETIVHPGDTLMVGPGTYPGFDIGGVFNTITVCSSHGRDVTFIDGQKTEDVGVDVRSANVCIEGFTIRNFRSLGMYLIADGIRIRNLRLVSNNYNLEPEGWGGSGISLQGSNMEVSDVIVQDNTYGILTSSGSGHNTLRKVSISHCREALLLSGHDHLIEKATITGCNYGINFTPNVAEAEVNNTIRKCVIMNNKYAGINIGYTDLPADTNTVYDNYFANNMDHIKAPEGARGIRWNIDKTEERNILGGEFTGGNYWDDYAGADLDEDGLGDTILPYGNGIAGGGPDGSGESWTGDFHPLVGSLPDLSVTASDITVPGTIEVMFSESAEQTEEVSATVRNLGAGPAGNINVVLYANGFQAGSSMIASIPAGGSASTTVSWNVVDMIHLHMRDLEAENRDAANTVWAEPPLELKVVVDPEEDILDLNRANNSAVKPAVLHVIPDLEITEVVPIQVVRDVPLILNKVMMTRVFMRLAPFCQEVFSVVHGIKARVSFDDGNAPQEMPDAPEMSLVDKEGTGYIVPRNKVSMFKNLMNNTVQLKQCLFENGWDALNLEHAAGTGPEPKRVGTLTVEAELLNWDSDLTVNHATATAAVKQSTMNVYRILYMPLDSWGTDHTRPLTRHVTLSHNHAMFLEAIYPVPEVREYYGYSRVNEEGRPLDPPTIYSFWVGERVRLARKATLISWFDWVDTVVWVIPALALGLGTAGVAQPQAGIGVFVDETQGFPLHVSAHEIGHTWGLAGGRGHIEEYLSASNIHALYPAGNGWDVRGAVSRLLSTRSHARYSFSPTDLSEPFNHLTHMGDHCVPSPWVREENYRRLMDGMWPWGGLVNGGSDPRMLFVSGEIQEDGTTELWPFFTRDGMEMPPEAGAYSFDCEAEGGAILSCTSFDPYFENNGEGVFACFAFPIPFPEGTANVLLRHEGTVLAQRSVSSTPPELDLGTVLGTGDDWFEMTCTADDEDGDSMEFLTAYSNDGTTWIPLESSFAKKKKNGKSAFTFDSLPLPGGSACTVKVVASDGINTVEEVSAPFIVPKKAPSAIIGDPETGAVYHERDTVSFNGFGYDAEDGTVDSATYVWTSSRDGELARGCEGFSTSMLSVGEHTITLHVHDSDSNPAESTITIQVEPGFTDSDTDTLPDWWEEENFESLILTAEDDPDGDLYSNGEEYAQGTDPNVSDAEGEEEGAIEGTAEGEEEGVEEGEGEGVEEGEGLEEGEGGSEGEGEGGNEGEGEGEEPKPECGCDKAGTPGKANGLFGDLLLLTLSGGVLILSSGRKW